MATKAKVMAHIAALGVTLDGPHRDPTTGELSGIFDAPHRKVWSHTDTHGCACSGANAKEFWANAWSDFGEEGLADCDAPDCDICADDDGGK